MVPRPSCRQVILAAVGATAVESLAAHSGMGKASRGTRPPNWLKGVQPIRHVKGGIWEIELTGYGRTLVGPYSELARYLETQGFDEEAHHIVGKEHLQDVRTSYTARNAPSVALERRLHSSLVSGRITAEQTYLGGRRGGRATVTRTEVADLYRDIYTFHTDFHELASITDNVLDIRTPPEGTTAPPARGRISAADRATGGDSRALSNKETSSRIESSRRRTAPPRKMQSHTTGATKTTGIGSESIPDIRTRSGRLLDQPQRLGKLRIGFGADLLIQVASELMLGILESKLSQVNEEGIQRDYRKNVYNVLLKHLIDETVEQVRSGIFSAAAESVSRGLSSQWLYLEYQYDLLMERQAKDVSDAIISIIRGFNFVEVYYGLEPVKKPVPRRYSKPLTQVIHRDKRRKISEDVFRYRFTHQLLVWDPEAAVVFSALRKERAHLLSLIEVTMKEIFNRSEASPWAPLHFSELERLVNQFQFNTAHKLLVDPDLAHRDFPRIPDEHKHKFKELSDSLAKADRLLRIPSTWPHDRRMVLALYLGADPFAPRNEIFRAEEERRRRRIRERLIGTGTVKAQVPLF